MYFDELKRAMEWLAGQEDTVFLGQAVADPGTAMSNTLKDVARNKLIELPIAEDMQMGMSIGLALDGFVPVSIYPRWNFLLLATNQLVNHLDRFSKITSSQAVPKVIIRTSIGSERPLHPQHQHIGDFTDAFRLLLGEIEVVKLEEANEIVREYRKAYEKKDSQSTLIVECGDFYNEK